MRLLLTHLVSGLRKILGVQKIGSMATGYVTFQRNRSEIADTGRDLPDPTSTNFGRGLRELGLEPKSNVCIFADTKAEW